jgi:hypothetical protein
MKSKIVSKDSIFNTLNVGDSTPISILNNRFNPSTDYIELHIANESGNLIKSHLDYQRYSLTKTTGFYDGSYESIDHSPINDLIYYGYVSGTYTLYYNFFRKIFSTSLDKYFFIKEISPSRKELRLAYNNLSNNEVQANFNRILTKIQSLSYVYNLVLNCGENIISQIINISLDTSENQYSILVKLDDPLDTNITTNQMCWVFESVALSTKYVIDLINEIEVDRDINIKGPNFNIEVDSSNSYNTKFLSSYDLNSVEIESLSTFGGFNASFSDAYSNALTQTYKNQIILSRLLKQGESASINVDYRNYANFINFSSAEDRLNNFIFKVKQIEEYNTTLDALKALPDSTQSRLDIDRIAKEKFTLISLFDGYEFFMYFEIDPKAYPKTDNEYPVFLYDTTSVQFQTWYLTEIEIAREFDRNNSNYVWKLLPQYIVEDSENDKLKLFIDGLGHYYDNIWIYIKSIESVYHNTNNLTTGVSKDIVKDLLVSFGIDLYNNSEEVDIALDLVGNNSGVLGIGNFDIVAVQDYTKEIYKRIYHNLPVLLKSKGTAKGIRTLLSIYGIPSSILDVDNRLSSFAPNTSSIVTRDRLFTKVGDSIGRVVVPFKPIGSNIAPKTLQFITIIPKDGWLMQSSNGSMTIVVTDLGDNRINFSVTIDSSNYTYQYIKRPSDDLYKFIFTYNSTNNTVYTYLTAGEGLLTGSLTITSPQWTDVVNGEFQFGRFSPNELYVSGIKIYDRFFNYNDVIQHFENPDYTGDGIVVDIPLGLDSTYQPIYLTNVTKSSTPYMYNIETVYHASTAIKYLPYRDNGQSANKFSFQKLYNNVNGNFVGFTDVYGVDILNDESIDAVSLFYKSFMLTGYTRNIESGQVVDTISDNILVPDISQDGFERQTTVVDVSLSKGKDVNKKIIDYFYNKDINSHFGNPNDMYLDEYSGVIQLRNDYFDNNSKHQYSHANYVDLARYINSSLFKMIDDFTPIGADIITGVSVQPLLTDRSKYKYIRSLNALDQIIEFDVGEVKLNGEFSNNIDVIIDESKLYQTVGNNKFLTNVPFNVNDFIKSNDNVLYGNVSNNVKYEFNSSNVNIGYKLYKITNNSIFNQWTIVTKFPNSEPVNTQIPGGSTKYICSSTYPTQPVVRVILGIPTIPLVIEVQNRYNCAFVEPEPIANTYVEFQESYLDLKSYTLPRYEGSKNSSKNLNVWVDGDSSYGKTAAVDSYVNHTALFTRIYSGSIGNQYNNVTIKYLVDSNGEFIDLNEMNKNIFDVQNIIRSSDKCTVSLFDALQYGNQKSTNGVKNVFSSGYFYKPSLYVSETDSSVNFIKESDSKLSRFEAVNIGGYISNSTTAIQYPSFLLGNEYYIYNIFDKINYNSFNSFTSGSVIAKTFPSYDVIESNATYQFKASFGMLVGFNPENLNTQTQYRLDIVTNNGGDQDFSDKILASELVTFHPEYVSTPVDRLRGVRVKQSWWFGLQIELEYPLYDRLNNKIIPPGLYNNYRINSEELLDAETSDWGDRYWFYFIVHNDNWYQTGEQLKRDNNSVKNRGFLNLGTISIRPITLSTPVISDLNVGDSVYFRFARLDSNPIIADYIGDGGSLSVDVQANATLETTPNIIHEIVNGNQIIFSTGLSAFYEYTQTSDNVQLIDKYGHIDDPFYIVPNDIISIKHPDSTKSYLYNVVSVIVDGNGLLVITVDKQIAMNIINEPNNFTEFVIFKRVLDETNIVLQFNKREGDTSSGLLIPNNINPEYMDKIDTIIKQIKLKLPS